MNIKATIAAAIAALLVSAFASQAIAANKPIKGKYKCKGTATQTVNLGSIGGGTQTAKVKGKMNATRGAFLISLTTPGWQSLIDGYLPTDSSRVQLSLANKTYKTMTRGCSVHDMFQSAYGYQNKSGKSVDFSIQQTYLCGTSGTEYVDKYILTCKR